MGICKELMTIYRQNQEQLSLLDQIQTKEQKDQVEAKLLVLARIWVEACALIQILMILYTLA